MLVEQQHGLPTVFVYALDPATRKYVVSSVQRGSFKVDVPFPIEIDLNEIDKL
ncbi:hypothetical protein GCM10009677_61520 [Sphaerisporangium rubeum]|uniref:Uncharacterized protein n=1 Tax=Sphaerisporangium rubeum TaxID=321317 RepID=A0A7X0M537_9ACTN|nr:hypothetical protein [Sphaerisporangium rubeum]